MLVIFDTIYISCPAEYLPELVRDGIKGEVLLGSEFTRKVPDRNSIKISSVGTIFEKYQNWYFHINCEDPKFTIYDVTRPMMTLDQHIQMVRNRNLAEIRRYESLTWMGVRGIGEKYAAMIARGHIPNSRVAKLMKNPKIAVTEVDLANCQNL